MCSLTSYGRMNERTNRIKRKNRNVDNNDARERGREEGKQGEGRAENGT